MKLDLPYDPTFGNVRKRTDSRMSKGYLHSSVCGSIIYSRQEVGATQMSISRWVDKENVVYAHNGILPSLKNRRKFGHDTTCVNLEDIVLNEIDQSQKKKTNNVWFHLYKGPQAVNSQKQETQLRSPGTGGGALLLDHVPSWKVKHSAAPLHNIHVRVVNTPELDA